MGPLIIFLTVLPLTDWLQCVVLSPPVHPGGASHQQVPVQSGGPAAPVPGGGVWPTCQQPSPHQTAGMSPGSSLPFTHRRGHTLCSNVVILIVLCRWSVSWTSSREGLSVTSWLLRTSSRVIKDGRNVFPHGSNASKENTDLLINCVLCRVWGEPLDFGYAAVSCVTPV